MQKKLDKKEMSATSNITNYFPHHEVFNVNEPGQVRVIYDGYAKYQRTTLKENLLSVLDLLNNPTSVLTRFRKGSFSSFNVSLVETDALRFLCKENLAEGLS